MNTSSLSFRLVTWYAGLLTIVFVLLGALTFVFLSHYLEANLLDLQERRAHQIADTLLAAADRTGEAAVARQVEALYAPEANDRFIRITRADGRIVYASRRPASGAFDPADVPAAAATDQHFVRRIRVPGGTLLIAGLEYSNAAGPTYRVEVGVSSASIEATLEQMMYVLAFGLPVTVCVAVAGGFMLVRRALRPVDRIAHKAEAISQHNLSERLPVLRTGDELQRLSVSLNLMISRLEDAVLSSKRFVADASHELRTPLTVMRGELENLAQDRQLSLDTRETLGSILEEVDRLADIVEGLLALSRLDAGEGQAERVTLDLAELAATTADQMGLLAEDKKITVVCESTPGVLVDADRARLKQVVVNLLDNAIKYTAAGGVVRLMITRDESDAILDVLDDGIGIPPDALPHVFERFFRVDDSRSRDRGGAGLGLSIVQSICTANGARVEVASTPGKGSRFRIRQPLSLQSSARAYP